MNSKKRVADESEEFVDLLNKSEAASELMDRFRQVLAELTEEFPEDADDPSLSAFVAGTQLGQHKAEKSFVAQLVDKVGNVGALGELLRGPSEVDEFFTGILRLGRKGLLANVRRCECERCGKWMFARRKDQRTCSATCRHKQYEQSPEAKTRRNAYMRWRYAMNDSRDWVESGIPKSKWPHNFEDEWLKHNEPTPREWEAIVKRERKR